MAAEENANPSGSDGASSGGGNKLVLILTVVNLLVTGGIGGVVYVAFKKSQAPTVQDISTAEEHAEAESGEQGAGKPAGEAQQAAVDPARRMVTLDQFTVNLTSPGSAGSKFVRVNISLELPNQEAETELTSRMPQVRNTIIDLVNSKRPGDLATAEGRDYLKEEILNALNAFMITGKVKGVFFTSFAVST